MYDEMFERLEAPAGAHWWVHLPAECDVNFEEDGSLVVAPAALNAEVFNRRSAAIAVPPDASVGDEVVATLRVEAVGCEREVVLRVGDAPIASSSIEITDVEIGPVSPGGGCFGDCLVTPDPQSCDDESFPNSETRSASTGVSFRAQGRGLLFVDVEPKPQNQPFVSTRLIDSPDGARFGPLVISGHQCVGRELRVHIVIRDVDAATVLFEQELSAAAQLPPQLDPAGYPPCEETEAGGCRLASASAPVAILLVLLARRLRRRSETHQRPEL